MATSFITNTASLKTTIAEVRKLNAKKMLLNGKNILEYIKENSTNILDERGTQANDELDIWNSYVTTDADGNVIANINSKLKEHSHDSITDAQKEKIQSATKIIDNQVLGADDAHLMYWQTAGLTDGTNLYSLFSQITTFDSDLSSLTKANKMFYGSKNLKSFKSDLRSLEDGTDMFRMEKRDYDIFSESLEIKSLNKLKKADGMFYWTNLSEFCVDLPNLETATSMFFDCSSLTKFNSDLRSLTNGNKMFSHCTNLKSFTTDLKSLTNGNGMFHYCEKLSEFNSDLSSLTNGNGMFSTCEALTKFTTDLKSLTNGNEMFQYCKNLSEFNSDLSSLETCSHMFLMCPSLKTVECDLRSLKSGYQLLAYSGVESFTSDLSSLTNGNGMFLGCENLTTFNAPLSSLDNGREMFHYSKLSSESVSTILHHIPQRDTKPTSSNNDGSGSIMLGIGISNSDEEKQAFAEKCYCDSWQDLLDEFDAKNWLAQFQFNGEATTYSLRKPATVVYTKLEEVFMPTEEEVQLAKENNEPIIIPHYEYVSQDGDNYYNIHWYNESNSNNEGYDCFESLEMATLSYGVLPKE